MEKDLLNNIFLYEGDDGGSGGGGNNPNPNPAPIVKTYNQDELNGIVGSRIAEERKKIYDLVGVANNEELTKRFEALTKLEQENATLKEHNASFEQKFARVEKEGKLLNAGIDPDFLDFALTKWDGEQDLAEFTKENPKLTKEYHEGNQFQGTGGSLDEQGGATLKKLEDMTEEEYIQYRNEQIKKGRIL